MSALARQTWIDQHVDIMVNELAELGLTARREPLADLLRERVRSVAAQMGVSEQTARGYLTTDLLRQLAREMAVQLVDEHPGANLRALRRTVSLDRTGLGRLLRGLATSARILAAGEDHDRSDECLGLLFDVGIFVPDTPADDSAAVLVPPAAMTRAARLLNTAADALLTGSNPDQLTAAEAADLSAGITVDVRWMRELAATQSQGDV
ncbi:hypothetical protein GB931_17065 [Modestobacter sp. I12A-02628]|uniref:Uncharacterized protein n=1 Tax=Goekera deserti TaxID=2497753 RepID=A0A7K3WE25_9ACTN|nr:hypothetical protein [Goekera deserti]MPQ99596.1 hypothetical protein [Goekera deserti]NDI46394.1 hypothetical protein [Goekera deserti]NEL54674.1 hypothetical protein [Goekera deserti]